MKTEAQVRELLDFLTNAQRETLPSRKPAIDAGIDVLLCVLDVPSALAAQMEASKNAAEELKKAVVKKAKDEAQLRAVMQG